MPYLILAGAGALGITTFTLGYGTSKSTDKVFNYALIGGALFLAYTVVKSK